MVGKRKVLSKIFNAKDAQDLEKIRTDIEQRHNVKLSDGKLISFFIDFYLKNMDVNYYPVTEEKPKGAPKKRKRKRGDRRERGEGEI